MVKTFTFRLCANGDAEACAREFINFTVHDLSDVLVQDKDYSAITWNVTETFVVKGLKGDLRLHFVNFDAKVDRGGFRGEVLEAPFLDFAKACIRYRHAAAPVSYSATSRRVLGLRCLESAFRYLGRPPEIWHLDPAIMNRAVELGTKGMAPSTAYKISSELKTLFEFCKEIGLLRNVFDWSHQVPFPGKMLPGTDRKASSKHATRLESIGAFHPLEEMLPTSHAWADQVYSCVLALLITMPIKVHELLQLRVNSEIEFTKLDEDGEHKTDFGLQIWPGKGNPPRVEWVSAPEYAAVAKRAVRTLREVLAPARELARWYEHNPSRLYLPPHLEHLRNAEWVTISEVQHILGVSKKAAHQWIDNKSIAKRVGDRQLGRGRGHGRNLLEVRFSDVELAILSLLPKDFPYVNGDERGHRYSEALLVVPVDALHAARSSWKCMFEAIGYEQFNKWLRDKHVPSSATSG